MNFSKFPFSIETGDVEEYIDHSNDSMAIEQPDIGDVEIIDGKAYRFIQAVGGGDINWYADGIKVTLNCTTNENSIYPEIVKTAANGRAAIELPLGTSSSVKFSFTCAILDMDDGDQIVDADILLANFEVVPHGTFLMISMDGLQSATNIVAEGPIVSQRTTECITHQGQGSISHMRENMRLTKQGSYWSGLESGITFNVNPTVRDNVNVHVEPGLVYQLHLQSFPSLNSAVDGIFYVKDTNSIGDDLPNYTKLNDLGQITDCRCGSSTQTDGVCYYLDIFGHVNNTEDNCKLFVTQPNRVYSDDSAVLEAARTDPFTRLPWESRTVGFHICRIVLRYNTDNGGTFTNLLSYTTSSYQEWGTVGLGTSVQSPNYPNFYPNNSNIYDDIQAPAGTNMIKLNFAAFNTEANYDYCKIYRNTTTLVATYHGNLGNNWQSVGFATDRLRVKFTSDGSVGRTGYRVSSYNYRILKFATANGSLVLDMRQ